MGTFAYTSSAIAICTFATDPFWGQVSASTQSLTITALAERAMSFIPPAAETTWSDAAHAL